MSDNRVLAVFTPNHDTYTNPTIMAFFSECKKQNIRIHFFAPEQVQPKPASLDNVEIFPALPYLKKGSRNILLWIKVLNNYLKVILHLRNIKPLAVIGIDPIGYTVAAVVNKFLRKTLGYFSFEFIVQKELEGNKDYLELKLREQQLSADCDFLLIQDEERFECLAVESRFKKELKTFLIPVAPEKIEYTKSSASIVPKGKIGIIHSGSVKSWSGIPDVLNVMESSWPEDYHLVIHSRAVLADDNELFQRINSMIKKGFPLSLSNKPFDNIQEYYSFLSAFDLGLALYVPYISKGIFNGKNLEAIGLASGKFGSYMMIGLPTITSKSKSFTELNKRYGFGAVLENIKDLPEELRKIEKDLSGKKAGCLGIYNEILNPEPKVKEMLRYIAE